jgi:hypothetical protein
MTFDALNPGQLFGQEGLHPPSGTVNLAECYHVLHGYMQDVVVTDQ